MIAIPGFAIHEQLASGDGWTLYRATRAIDNAKILLKIAPEVSDEDGVQSLLEAEKDVLSHIDSRYVLSVNDTLSLRGQVIQSYEDFAGYPFTRILGSGALPVHEVLQVAIELCRALSAIHACGITHGYIRPSAILVERKFMRLRLTNFFSSTHSGMRAGSITTHISDPESVHYIAPEQTGRVNREIDHRSDLYSAGAVLYRALVGWPPFRSADPMEVIHGHLAREAAAPRDIDGDIPDTLSRIVVALLSKDPERRYQSAENLRIDLERCRDELASSGHVSDFRLTVGRASGRFDIPQGLIGREAEFAQLAGALSRTVRGDVTSLIIEGYAGVGKTSLVCEITPLTLRYGGYFIKGKADQLKRDTPYFVLTSAFRDFVTQILMEDRQRLSYWQSRFRATLLPVAGVVTRLIPELEFFLGSYHEVEDIPHSEAMNRFREAVRRLFDAITDHAHPLVLFLDDLQWADNETLQLLGVLFSGETLHHLMFVGAIRGHEIDSHHPANDLLRLLSQSEGYEGRIALQPLPLDQIDTLIAETLSCPRSHSRLLAEILCRKTQGNPFFIKQFLTIIHEDGLLRFNGESEQWEWDVDAIEKLPHSENVVLLLTQRIQTYPKETQHTLTVASFLGSSFTLSTMSAIADESELTLQEELRPAIESRLLLRADRGDRPTFQLPGKNGSDPVFRFLHDRVQQAAYALTPEDQRPAVHLRIGRRLLQYVPDDTMSDYAFALADQLNAGISLIDDPSERRALARLNFSAGMKAANSVAFTSAMSYFRTSLQLTGDDWEAEFTLLWQVTRELGRAEYALGNHAAALEHFSQLRMRARTPMQAAEAISEHVHLLIHFGEYKEALEMGREGLRLVGQRLPRRINKLHVLVEIIRTRLVLRGRTPESLLALAPMQDSNARFAVRLMTALLTAAYFASKESIGFFDMRMMNLVSSRGMVESAAYVFSQYGLILGAGLGQYQRALDYAAVGVRLANESSYPYWKTRVYLTMGAVVNHWVRDLRENLDYLRKAHQYAQECGDLLFGMYPLQFSVTTRSFLGHPLDAILEDVARTIHYSERIQHTTVSMRTYRQFLLDLKGETETPGSLQSAEFDEPQHLEELEASGDTASLVAYYILRVHGMYHAERYDDAYRYSKMAANRIDAALGQLMHVEFVLYTGLSAAAIMKNGAASFGVRRTAHSCLRKLSRWADLAPMNYGYQAALLRAEIYAAAGRRMDALHSYEQALSGAASRGDLQIEAVAALCAARYNHRQGLDEHARGLTRRAMNAYINWGAPRLAERCRLEFSALISADPRHSRETATVQRGVSESYDIASLMKAAAAISGEILLPRLLDKLMSVMVENAGAESGVLFLEDEGDLLATVRWDPAQKKSMPLEGVPLEETPRVPQRLLRYVERTRLPVLLDNAAGSEQFQSDPDICKREVLSVLCMPILYQSDLAGVVYLENNLSAGAFGAERNEFLQLLSSQIATALVNARLYARLDDARQSLEEYSQGLERKVQERTRDLEQQGIELKASNEELGRAIKDLRKAQSQLIQAEKMASLGELTAGIAHEIQNPLNFIKNFAELTIELAGELNSARSDEGAAIEIGDLHDTLESLVDISTKIREHSMRAGRIVKSMLDHSRTGGQDREQVDINLLLEEAFALSYHGMRARDKNFHTGIETSYDSTIPRISVIPQDISRVFLNIFSNCLYFLREKQAQFDETFEALLSVRSQVQDDMVEIRVRDNGPGISAKARAKIFQPFFTTKPSGEGTGLGLSISYTIIVEGHGGSMETNSQPGEWTEFVIRLPLTDTGVSTVPDIE